MPTDKLHLTIVLRRDEKTNQEAMEVHAAFQDGEYEDVGLLFWEDLKTWVLDGLPRPVTISSGKQTVELIPLGWGLTPSEASQMPPESPTIFPLPGDRVSPGTGGGARPSACARSTEG